MQHIFYLLPANIASSFLTPAAEKIEIQVQNSSQKLKEKTQPQGGSFLRSRKTQGENSILNIFSFKKKF